MIKENFRNLDLSKETFLEQSELYNVIYKEYKDSNTIIPNEIGVDDLDDWFYKILSIYSFLNDGQKNNLKSTIGVIKSIINIVETEKLKMGVEGVEEENELIVWRKSKNGVSKIIFDEFAEITFSYIGYDGKKIMGIFNNNVDFEKLIYKFLLQ